MSIVSSVSSFTSDPLAAGKVDDSLEKSKSKSEGEAKVSVELSGESLRDRLVEVVLKVTQEIAADNLKRLQGCAGDIKLLSEGVYYDITYYEALKKVKGSPSCQKRLAWMRDNSVFFTGMAPKEFFSQIKNPKHPMGVNCGSFKINKGKLPSDALAAIRKGLTFMGCGEVCQIGYYEALLSIFGIEKFNALFAADSPTPLTIQHRSVHNPLFTLLTQKVLDPSFKDLKRGHLCHIEGAKNYPVKHLFGPGRSFNVFCLEALEIPKFVGLGLNPQGATNLEIAEILFDEFNKNPVSITDMLTEEVANKILQSYTAENLENIRRFRDIKISHEIFRKTKGGGTYNLVFDFNIERISVLMKGSIESGCKLFVKWAQKDSFVPSEEGKEEYIGVEKTR
jgi:hypothetical protein